ncbi:Cryptochrome/photolyase FAD-binding domain-containing protein [Trematosphaeria pertusa]|uniref:Cryptochrome/photolyase FAD-binding domain-containing protein n=1 Tax=Trematosphaeria pertusa TaxID=390896 RepID=A0A6A6IGC6_9PLEO|nr:Cryptochrome/photolyase FAD-binding domain-containing protein [Trematosphaeria pertusa]KAF2249461.1 Cryptochrome/photolyase FAD-binding domain-containing protein [Trematosphaeria pertusa]
MTLTLTDATFDALHAGIPFKWTEAEPYDTVNPFGDFRQIDFKALWTFDIQNDVLLHINRHHRAQIPLGVLRSRPVTLGDMEPLGPPVPPLLHPTLDSGMPCWKPQIQVDERNRAFIYRILRDFNHQWRHILRNNYNTITLRVLARAIIRLSTLDFEVREETSSRHGLGGDWVYITELPTWKPFNTDIVHVGDVHVVICHSIQDGLSRAKKHTTSQQFTAANGTRDCARKRPHYMILSVKHIMLCRAIGPNELKHTAPEPIFNGNHGVGPPSNLALDYLLWATAPAIGSIPTPLRSLPIEVQDIILGYASPRVIYWFRTDLRLHDSPALKAALDLKPECLYPIWTWDPHYVYRARAGPNRWQFLLDCQNDLSNSITKLNPNSKLFVIRVAPQTLFSKLFREWQITHLVFEKDTDAYARERDDKVMELAKEAGVEVVVKTGRTLYDPDELVKHNKGKPTMSISQVQAAGAKIGHIPRPIPAPKSLPDPGKTELSFDQEKPASDLDFNAIRRNADEKSYNALAGPNGDFAVPTMEELGLKEATTPHRGGETIALKMLDEIAANEDYTATFEKPKTAPTAFEPQATTLLSPHLHFGSLSSREFYWRAQDIVSTYAGKASHPPTSLTGQLLFRDMYFGAQAALGHAFAQTYNNPHCRFIPWHLPSSIDPKTGLTTGTYLVDSAAAEIFFQRWKEGRTGFPWIDALMRQLRQEGWIHHLGRHAVACFLTRGGCYVDWERGAAVFEEWLIDHEAACNVGNWQWLSCTAFFAQFYRCYSPVAFPRKWDKEGAFVRRYVPELERFDARFVYEPWRAPVADQKRWGCLIKGDGVETEEGGFKVYPKPMFDFAERREICIQGMKNAYRVALYGNDPKVLDGSWRELFDDAAEGPTEGKDGPPGAMVEHEDADEMEMPDKEQTSPKTVKIMKKGEAEGKKTGVHKRAASQRTLDGMITRKRRKSK